MARWVGRAWMSWSSRKGQHLRHSRPLDAIRILEVRRFAGDRQRGRPTAFADARGCAVRCSRHRPIRLGLPLPRSWRSPRRARNDVYGREKMSDRRWRPRSGTEWEHVVFGDLYLEDVRRVPGVAGARRPPGIDPVFPLWRRPTDAARSGDGRGRRSRRVITCVDPRQLPRLSFRGAGPSTMRCWRSCPNGVDPCGGERRVPHVRSGNGPGFSSPIAVETGEVLERDGFVFLRRSAGGVDGSLMHTRSGWSPRR